MGETCGFGRQEVLSVQEIAKSRKGLRQLAALRQYLRPFLTQFSAHEELAASLQMHVSPTEPPGRTLLPDIDEREVGRARFALPLEVIMIALPFCIILRSVVKEFVN